MTDVERLAEVLVRCGIERGRLGHLDADNLARVLMPTVDAIAQQRAVDEQEAILAALRGEGAFPRTELGDVINNLFGRAEAAEHVLGVTRQAAEHALEVVRQERDALRAAIRWHTWAGQGQLAQLRKALGE